MRNGSKHISNAVPFTRSTKSAYNCANSICIHSFPSQVHEWIKQWKYNSLLCVRRCRFDFFFFHLLSARSCALHSFSLSFHGQFSLWLLNPSEKVSTPIKFTLQVLVCDSCHYVKWIDLASISNRFNVHTRNQQWLNQLLIAIFWYGNKIISGIKHVAHR